MSFECKLLYFLAYETMPWLQAKYKLPRWSKRSAIEFEWRCLIKSWPLEFTKKRRKRRRYANRSDLLRRNARLCSDSSRHKLARLEWKTFGWNQTVSQDVFPDSVLKTRSVSVNSVHFVDRKTRNIAGFSRYARIRRFRPKQVSVANFVIASLKLRNFASFRTAAVLLCSPLQHCLLSLSRLSMWVLFEKLEGYRVPTLWLTTLSHHIYIHTIHNYSWLLLLLSLNCVNQQDSLDKCM